MSSSKELIARLDRALKLQAPAIYEALDPGASEEEIEAFRASIGVELPELFYDLFRWRNGSSGFLSFLEGLELCSLERARSIKQVMDEHEAGGVYDRWMPQEWWHPSWVPILDNRSYDTWCIDTAGCFGGSPGQILVWSKDSESRTAYCSSLRVFIERLIELLISEELQQIEEEGYDPTLAPPGHAIVYDVLPFEEGYPREQRARSRLEMGIAREPKPIDESTCDTDRIEVTILDQVWMPQEQGARSLAYLEGEALVAVAQYEGHP